MRTAPAMMSPAMLRSAASPRAVVLIYACAVLHGLALVSFPASSTVLQAMHGLTDAQYGAAFLPQVGLAVVGAVAGGTAVRRIGLRGVLLSSLLAVAASQALLALTVQLPHALAFAGLLAGTGLLGLGFGLAGAPLNAWPATLFPERANAALVAMHTAIGLGLTGGPLLAGALMAHWVAFPLSLCTGALLLGVLSLGLPAEAEVRDQRQAAKGEPPLRAAAFWLFAAIAVLYAFAEGTFANWAVIFLKEGRGFADPVAAAGLSVFWGGLVAGRLLVSALLLRVAAWVIWAVLPVAMIGVFCMLPSVSGPVSGLALFAAAGLACSAFFPLTIGLATQRFAAHAPWVASMLTAALMLGVGAGSFAIGGLRASISFDILYPVSALYPAAALGLMALFAWQSRRRSRT